MAANLAGRHEISVNSSLFWVEASRVFVWRTLNIVTTTIHGAVCFWEDKSGTRLSSSWFNNNSLDPSKGFLFLGERCQT